MQELVNEAISCVYAQGTKYYIVKEGKKHKVISDYTHRTLSNPASNWLSSGHISTFADNYTHHNASITHNSPEQNYISHNSLTQDVPPQRSASASSTQRALFTDEADRTTAEAAAALAAERVSADEQGEMEASPGYEAGSPTSSFLYNGKNKNETDDHKVNTII